MSWFLERPEPAARSGKRVYDGPLASLSVDHPLNLPPGGPTPFEGVTRRGGPNTRPTGYAGHASNLSMSVREVLTGKEGTLKEGAHAVRTEPRHQYNHPTYAVSRSQNGSAVKDLLYGNAPPPPPPPAGVTASPPPSGHPLAQVFAALADIVPQLPRDGEGGCDEVSMRDALAHFGLELSMDGFAELLARCDVSPTGFPPFADFMLCVSRPERNAPPEPAQMGGAAALPQHMQPGVMEAETEVIPQPPPSGGLADYTSAALAVALPNAQYGVPPPAAAPPPYTKPSASELAHMQQAKEVMSMPAGPAMGERTWRAMQMEEEMRAKQHQGLPPPQPPQAPLGPNGRPIQTHYQYVQPAMAGYHPAPAPAGPKGGSFPLGMRASNVPTLGTNVASIYAKNLRQRGHASSQKFTNSFNPDFFVL